MHTHTHTQHIQMEIRNNDLQTRFDRKYDLKSSRTTSIWLLNAVLFQILSDKRFSNAFWETQIQFCVVVLFSFAFTYTSICSRITAIFIVYLLILTSSKTLICCTVMRLAVLGLNVSDLDLDLLNIRLHSGVAVREVSRDRAVYALLNIPILLRFWLKHLRLDVYTS